MFVSQLSPHHDSFGRSLEYDSYEAETTGAVKRIVTPDEVALEDPKDQPPDYGPPMDDDMAYSRFPSRGNSSILIQMMKICIRLVMDRVATLMITRVDNLRDHLRQVP